MLISFGNAGQFGNLYLASAHRIAHAIDNGYKLSLYELGKYRKYFVTNDKFPRIRLGGDFPQGVVEFVNQAARRLTCKNDFRLGCVALHFDRAVGNHITGAEIAGFANAGLVVHQGWSFRDRDALIRQVVKVREILDFKNEYKRRATARFNKIRGAAKTVIGVHVRRGDYAQFHDGQFFFDDSVYLRVVAEAIASNGYKPESTVIAGFSNEKLEWPKFCLGSRVVTESGAWWEDFLCLSMCDLIIGPPSTYSGAASFVNDVNWFQIRSNDSPFLPEEARPLLESGIKIH